MHITHDKRRWLVGLPPEERNRRQPPRAACAPFQRHFLGCFIARCPVKFYTCVDFWFVHPELPIHMTFSFLIYAYEKGDLSVTYSSLFLYSFMHFARNHKSSKKTEDARRNKKAASAGYIPSGPPKKRTRQNKEKRETRQKVQCQTTTWTLHCSFFLPHPVEVT